MKKVIFEGCGTAISTPFTEDGVNFEEFGKLLEDQNKKWSWCNNCMWYNWWICDNEWRREKEVIKYAINKVNKRTKVVIGTGSNNTKSAVKMSKFAEEAGADALLVVTPFYNKTTQEGLIVHYKTIAEAVKIPIIMYSVPSRTGVNITPETCLELSKIENIVAIKEASGNISQGCKNCKFMWRIFKYLFR